MKNICVTFMEGRTKSICHYLRFGWHETNQSMCVFHLRDQATSPIQCTLASQQSSCITTQP
jgi:hypothetical protein